MTNRIARAPIIGRPVGAPEWIATRERRLGRPLAPGKPGPQPRMQPDPRGNCSCCKERVNCHRNPTAPTRSWSRRIRPQRHRDDQPGRRPGRDQGVGARRAPGPLWRDDHRVSADSEPLCWGRCGCRLSNPTLTKTWERGPASIVEARCASPVPPRERPTPLRGTEGSNPFPSSGESGANLTSSIMLGYARSDSGPCRLGPTHAVIALVSAPGSTLADSHVAGPRGRSEEWYYKRGFGAVAICVGI